MRKCDEVRDPESCLNHCERDEPIFVIRAKDPLGSTTVRSWAQHAVGIHEKEKIAEANMLADIMDNWRNSRK